jgi:sulfonate transport system permease protein
MRKRARLLLIQLAIAVAVLLIWYVGSSVPIGDAYFLPKFFFSTPGDVLARIIKMFSNASIWRHIYITLTETALAFFIGSGLGIVIGFWFARRPTVAAVLDPYVKAANALPRVVLAPIFMLGSGSASGRRSRLA